VDLSHLQWVGPSMMVAFMAFIDAQARAGRKIEMIGPLAQSPANYLSRMGFRDLLGDLGIAHGLPQVRSDASLESTALVSVSRFAGQDEAAAMVEMIDYHALPAPLGDVLCRALLETANNVPEHAQVECGYMAAQVVDKGRTLRVSVADAGVGLLATLAKTGAGSDIEAVRMAVAGTSETGDPARGRGLSSVRSALKENNGVGFLLSGQSILTMKPDQDSPWSYNIGYPGTVFDARIEVPSKTS